MVENEEEEEQGRGGKLLLPSSFLPFLSFISPPPFPFPFSRYTIISLPPFSFIPGYYFAELFIFPPAVGKRRSDKIF